MKFIKSIFWMIFLLFLAQCSQKKGAIAEDLELGDLNYPLPGFDLEGSDPLAIVLADRIMSAMGGREAWNKTRYIKWKFFGRRTLLWDKESARVRIEIEQGDQVILLDLNQLTGKVFRQGIELTDPDSVSFYLAKGERPCRSSFQMWRYTCRSSCQLWNLGLSTLCGSSCWFAFWLGRGLLPCRLLVRSVRRGEFSRRTVDHDHHHFW